MPAWITRAGSTMPSSMARRNTVPCEYGSPLYVSQRSVWESRCTSPRGPWTEASARSSASVTEWSPPIPSGTTPAAAIGFTYCSIRCSVSSM